MKRGIVLGAVLVLIGVVAIGGMSGWRDYQREQECDQIEAGLRARGDAPVGDGQSTISVLGDSYAQGWELDDPRDSWATALAENAGATVYVHGFAGTGFTGSTYCDGEDFGSRAASVRADDADVVVVQGGLNDLDASAGDLRAAAVNVERETGADVVIGPPPAPQRDAAALKRADAALSAAAEDEGVAYVSTLGWTDLTYLDDGLHLDQRSHDLFGQRVAEAIR